MSAIEIKCAACHAPVLLAGGLALDPSVPVYMASGNGSAAHQIGGCMVLHESVCLARVHAQGKESEALAAPESADRERERGSGSAFPSCGDDDVGAAHLMDETGGDA